MAVEKDVQEVAICDALSKQRKVSKENTMGRWDCTTARSWDMSYGSYRVCSGIYGAAPEGARVTHTQRARIQIV